MSWEALRGQVLAVEHRLDGRHPRRHDPLDLLHERLLVDLRAAFDAANEAGLLELAQRVLAEVPSEPYVARAEALIPG